VETADLQSAGAELNGTGGVTPLAYLKGRNERLLSERSRTFRCRSKSLAERPFLVRVQPEIG